MDTLSLRPPSSRWTWLPGLAVWALGWAAMAALDGRLDLANLAMLLVLAAACAALWWPAWLAMAAAALSVAAFNWRFVPPRGSFTVDLRQHALLLAAMLAVSWIVALLMARQRRLTEHHRALAAQTEQLRALGDALRDTQQPIAAAARLREALGALVGAPATLLMLQAPLPERDDPQAAALVGEADADALAGLWLSLRLSRAFGPGTGHHAELDTWLLPMRGRQGSFGAARLPLAEHQGRLTDALRAHAQALCDQMGVALERALALRASRQAQDEAQAQKLRNTLLAAISHDYRTPLATIVGAASALLDQADRLAPDAQRRLAARIVEEAGRLSRLTDNTLQLARLDAPGLALQLDWESAEEIVGSVLRHARPHDPGQRLRVRLAPDLPLLRCDALLLVQLLDNLVDNALKYSDPPAPVELLVRRVQDQVVLAVRDRGVGIPPAARQRIFEVFQRGDQPGDRASRPGAGVGLAVCRAIARAHGGELRLRARGHGGASFECVLPVVAPPQAPEVTEP